MATPFQKVFDSFLSKIEADDWMIADTNLCKEDWKAIMDAAIMNFKYPRISLDYNEEEWEFNEDLTNAEIQVLSNLMKLEWLRRCLATWDNIRQLYSDKDFSQANMLDKLNKTTAQAEQECRVIMDRYSRSEHYKPNSIFGDMAGK